MEFALLLLSILPYLLPAALSHLVPSEKMEPTLSLGMLNTWQQIHPLEVPALDFSGAGTMKKTSGILGIHQVDLLARVRI